MNWKLITGEKLKPVHIRRIQFILTEIIQDRCLKNGSTSVMKLFSSVSVVLLFHHFKAVLVLLLSLVLVASTLTQNDAVPAASAVQTSSSSGRSLLAIKESPDDPNNSNQIRQQNRLVHPWVLSLT